ncbi:hypothetical protein A0H81_03178 [Grifola frondosa]|uniref:Uncharacterized protein n=1 Tax=Grifola frondosa TaxID=5627 RepID=A0A1C7MK85_GRIFR|nr:hypothetical protein A0H81_03178 [Grifola frondosa]
MYLCQATREALTAIRKLPPTESESKQRWKGKLPCLRIQKHFASSYFPIASWCESLYKRATTVTYPHIESDVTRLTVSRPLSCIAVADPVTRKGSECVLLLSPQARDRARADHDSPR